MSIVKALYDKYTLSDETLVWSPSDTKPFSYSDGHSEDVLWECFDNAIDVSCGSEELQQHMTDWPMRYHLSPQRADLLRPLQHLLTKRVLEIGSGCGAITRYLGETAEQVVGVEGAGPRAAITRKRCRDLANVQVVCDNAMHFDEPGSFDAVTLIGVLEYSRQYVDAKDPVAALLRHCRAQLAPDGALIIAIENQLGAKYFAGAPEDHVGQFFYGINDLYTDKSVVTFGKRELREQLTAAGFADIAFYYPYPDYKIPSVILTEDGAQNPGDLVDNLASRMSAKTQHKEYPRLFSEEMLTGPIARNGLLGDLANSFLVVARPQMHKAVETEKATTQAFVYSTCRARRFAKETVLSRTKEGLVVKRRHLYPHLDPSDRSLRQHMCNKPVLEGRLYSTVARHIVNRPGWSVVDLAVWARPWVQYLQARAIPTEHDDLPNVPGALLDCCPFNMVRRADDTFETFDLEWTLEAPVPMVWIILRGIWHSLGMLQSVASPKPGTPVNMMLLIAGIMDELGFVMNIEELKSIWKLEVMFFNAADAAAWGIELRVRVDPLTYAQAVQSQQKQLQELTEQKGHLHGGRGKVSGPRASLPI